MGTPSLDLLEAIERERALEAALAIAREQRRVIAREMRKQARERRKQARKQRQWRPHKFTWDRGCESAFHATDREWLSRLNRQQEREQTAAQKRADRQAQEQAREQERVARERIALEGRTPPQVRDFKRYFVPPFDRHTRAFTAEVRQITEGGAACPNKRDRLFAEAVGRLADVQEDHLRGVWL